MAPETLFLDESVGKATGSIEELSTCSTEISNKSMGFRFNGCWPDWSAERAALSWQSFPQMDPERYVLDHVIRAAGKGQSVQIEVLVDRTVGMKLVAKRFPRAYLKDDPRSFRESSGRDSCCEDPWTEMTLALKLGCSGPERVRGVLPCWGVYKEAASGDVLLLLEWAPGGDIFDLASTLGEPGSVRESTAAQVLCSLLDVVTRLHGLGIAHGDVSAENMVLRVEAGELEVALLDFGMAIHDVDLTCVTGARGKLMYQAPETTTESPAYDARAADLFACGVVGYVLAIGNYPWQSTAGDCKAFAYARRHGLRRFFEKRTIDIGSTKVSVAKIFSAGYMEALLALLDFDPARRCNIWANP